MSNIKLLMVFGTRPEAIKLVPLITKIQLDNIFDLVICNSSQHKELLQSVIKDYNIKVDYDLNVMESNQTLESITIKVIEGVSRIIQSINPDYLVVHGDTTTTFAASLAAFYNQIKVVHIESGLRTFDRFSPFPEEFNRTAVSRIASYHFAPTKSSKKNLIREGIESESIFVTGNTIVDLVSHSYDVNFTSPILEWVGDGKFILLTAHRRENLISMPTIFKAIRDFMLNHLELKLVYPIHKNPKIIELAKKYFSDLKNIKMFDSLDTKSFHNILARSYFVVTDSGGVQEEAPTFRIPVVLMRVSTERPEALNKGILLAGTDYDKITTYLTRLISDDDYYNKSRPLNNPFGDGLASKRIIEKIKSIHENN
jgi:UDP-N-acetylglucosamine 2-epimerase (non-hydrolysing)